MLFPIWAGERPAEGETAGEMFGGWASVGALAEGTGVCTGDGGTGGSVSGATTLGKKEADWERWIFR